MKNTQPTKNGYIKKQEIKRERRGRHTLNKGSLCLFCYRSLLFLTQAIPPLHPTFSRNIVRVRSTKRFEVSGDTCNRCSSTLVGSIVAVGEVAERRPRRKKGEKIGWEFICHGQTDRESVGKQKLKVNSRSSRNLEAVRVK